MSFLGDVLLCDHGRETKIAPRYYMYNRERLPTNTRDR
jgi:hypothetical protein